MVSLKTVETKIEGLFKGFPAMPDTSKESLVKAWPWIALVFGIIQLLAAWGLWHLANVVDRLNTLVTYYTAASPLSAADKTIIYAGVLVLLADAIILLMAYPQLKVRSKRGWDLLFLGSLLNVAYAVVQLFIQDRGLGSFIGSLIGSAVGFYLLFQVKSKYGAAKK